MDLDLLMRLVRPGALALIVAAIGMVAYGNALLRYPRQWYREWRYPPVKDVSGQGSDIIEAVEKRKSADVESLYRRVSAVLSQAALQGLPVAGLQKKVDVALALNRPGYRAQAAQILSQIELEIPKKKEGYSPADPDQADLDLPREAKPVKASRRKRRRK